MSSEMWDTWYLAGFVVVAFAIGAVVGICAEKDRAERTSTLRSEAVERGYAEWVTDIHGESQWRWVEGE